MKPGDTFEVEVQGVGVLRNRIVAARPGRTGSGQMKLDQAGQSDRGISSER